MNEVVEYSVNEAEIAKLSDIYMRLTISDLDNKEEFNQVHTAKMTMVRHRCDIDKLRKSSNANAQKFIKNNNSNAKKLLALIEPIETHLKAEEAKVTAEKERIRLEAEKLEKIKIEERVTALFAVSVNIPYFEAAMLSDAEYMVKLDAATNEYNAVRIRLQEEQRLKEEAEAKLAAGRAEIERIKKEQEVRAKEQADKEAALEKQAKAIEDEKKAEAERKEREAFEKKAKEEAKAQSEKEAKEKAERLEKKRLEAEEKRKAKEKADREAKIQETKDARFAALKEIGFEYPFGDLGIMPDRQYSELYSLHKKDWDAKQEALRPDREKLISFAAELTCLDVPDIQDAKADLILEKAETRIAAIADEIIKQAKEL